ncbi:MAG: hypothetical protein HYR88_14150 [Verrucomicrobia bacterium]|nr:hypothetical protein [Verrucomicrobiota bacterium]
MRARFLEQSAGQADYWESESHLFSYDQTFAQRVAWKWDYVGEQLKRRGWAPRDAPILDWGCGTGVAHRCFFRAFPAAIPGGLQIYDRSSPAMGYAERRAQAAFKELSVRPWSPEQSATGVVLLSHVVTELSDAQFAELLQVIRFAAAIVWVEPGTFAASRKLIEARERLRDTHHLVAPCVHSDQCGLTLADHSHDWCHHFASPPPEAFTSPHWAAFAKLMGIDLRSLPLSYLVLDRRPVNDLPEGAARVLGRPRVYKAHALVLGCDASGVQECRVSKRNLPELFRSAKKGEFESLQVWKRDGAEIVAEGRVQAGVEPRAKASNDAGGE